MFVLYVIGLVVFLVWWSLAFLWRSITYRRFSSKAWTILIIASASYVGFLLLTGNSSGLNYVTKTIIPYITENTLVVLGGFFGYMVAGTVVAYLKWHSTLNECIDGITDSLNAFDDKNRDALKRREAQYEENLRLKAELHDEVENLTKKNVSEIVKKAFDEKSRETSEAYTGRLETEKKLKDVTFCITEFEKYRDNHHRSRVALVRNETEWFFGTTAYPPLIHQNKSRFSSWIVCWPVVGTVLIVRDPVTRICRKIYNVLGGHLQKVSDAKFASIVESVGKED